MIKVQLAGMHEIQTALNLTDRRIATEVERSLAFLLFRLQKRIKTDKLLGQVLNRRTGNLRANIVRQMEQNGKVLSGVVGIAPGAPYGKLHEYGFSGTVSVPAHIRMQKQAFGRRLKTPLAVKVSAHTRKLNLPERSFMRTALADIEPLVQSEFNAALERGLNGT
ncbi:MAG: HK97 gp10 family phage protein [Neisseria sp.]|nr:HK97 gp10 family phage protein [Neisseria sp.]